MVQEETEPNSKIKILHRNNLLYSKKFPGLDINRKNEERSPTSEKKKKEEEVTNKSQSEQNFGKILKLQFIPQGKKLQDKIRAEPNIESNEQGEKVEQNIFMGIVEANKAKYLLGKDTPTMTAERVTCSKTL